MYLEKRRNRWFALHDIPLSVQGTIGRKRYFASLGTGNRADAERLAKIKEMQWDLAIEQARAKLAGNADPTDAYAKAWRYALLEASTDAEREALRHHIADLASGMAQPRGFYGAPNEDQDNPVVIDAERKAERFFDVATGKLVGITEHLDAYLDTISVSRKTKDMRKSSITKFAAKFRYVSDVTRKGVQGWISNDLLTGKGQGQGIAGETVARMVSDLRGYWSYLQSIEVVSDNTADPFAKLTIPKAPKGQKKKAAYTAQQVEKLYQGALERKDQELADLIDLGRYTGARREELCSMKTDAVNLRRGSIHVVEGKSHAAIREVPIHSHLKRTIKRMIEGSKDGYLVTGQVSNQYKDRGDAIGKRFGYLKSQLGFGRKHDFHSLRRTVATLLENAGVPENVSADILGHDKPTMTYGLYSGGASLAVKRAAIEKLRY